MSKKIKVLGDPNTGQLTLWEHKLGQARQISKLHPHEAAALALQIMEALLTSQSKDVQAEFAPLLPDLGSATPTVGGVNLSFKPHGSKTVGALLKLTTEDAQRLGAELASAAKSAI